MKQCTKCKECRELDEFSNNKNTKDGKHPQCKECIKQNRKRGYENNKEYVRQKSKQQYENNKEHIKQRVNQGKENNEEYVKQYKQQGYENNKEYLKQRRKQNHENNKEYYKELGKQYRENNKEYRKQYGKQYRHSPISGNEDTKPRREIGEYEDITESENGNLMCKCAYCEEGFEPTRGKIGNRLDGINGRVTGENRLYCSEKCKENCPIFGQQKYRKDQKPEVDREVQPQLREIVLERDNYTCQNCKIHQDDLEVGLHCHHIWPINEDPHGSADKVNCITLCEYCHKEVHQKPGCGYSELKCNS